MDRRPISLAAARRCPPPRLRTARHRAGALLPSRAAERLGARAGSPPGPEGVSARASASLTRTRASSGHCATQAHLTPALVAAPRLGWTLAAGSLALTPRVFGRTFGLKLDKGAIDTCASLHLRSHGTVSQPRRRLAGGLGWAHKMTEMWRTTSSWTEC